MRDQKGLQVLWCLLGGSESRWEPEGTGLLWAGLA